MQPCIVDFLGDNAHRLVSVETRRWRTRTGLQSSPARVKASAPRLSSGSHATASLSRSTIRVARDQHVSSYAEYVAAPARDLAFKPAGIDHVHAAGAPMAGLTAWQFLIDLGHDEPNPFQPYPHRPVPLDGRKVLINGAAEDVAHDVDLILDAVGGPATGRFLKSLKRGGALFPVFPGFSDAEEAAERSITVSMTQVRSNGRQLAELGRLLNDGTVRVAIDSALPLAAARKAHERAAQGHIRGKIVLTVV